MKTLLIIALYAGLVFGLQAQRDEADSTDNLNISPLQGLHFIDVTTQEDVFSRQGIKKKADDYQYYFRVEGEEEYTRVSYFANNLSLYVMPVPEAHRIVKSYRNLKVVKSLLFIGGIVCTAAGAGLSIKNGSFSPLVLVGVGLFSSSWIPGFFSHTKIPEAVGAYNARIGEFKDSNP